MPHAPNFKTRAMVRIERRVGRPIEDYLDEQYRSRTQQQIADELGVSQAAVGAWLVQCGIEPRLQGQRPPAEAVA